MARACGSVHGIVGHSMGGAATGLAMAEGLCAKRVVLIAPGAEPRYFARQLAGWLGLSERATDEMLRRVLQRLGGAWVEYEIPNLVRAVRAPMLLIHDAQDTDVPWEHGRAIAAAWPGARLETVHGLGHRRVLRDPDVTRRVLGFVSAGSSAHRAA